MKRRAERDNNVMAALRRTQALGGVVARLTRLTLTPQQPRPTVLTSFLTAKTQSRLTSACSLLHTSSSHRDLMQFFDDKKNWGETEVKVGRAWKIEELRIKSNEDLHKLWFVLLKEKNMLLTMEHACEEEYQVFPNPERIDKVEESMKHIEDVVKERNRAYFLLETGEDGERPGALTTDDLGQRVYKKFAEHFIPEWMNPHARRIRDYAASSKFSRLWREQKYLEKKKARTRMRNHVYMLLRRFPDMDMDVLQQKYPEVNVRALRHHKRARGHHLKNLG